MNRGAIHAADASQAVMTINTFKDQAGLMVTFHSTNKCVDTINPSLKHSDDDMCRERFLARDSIIIQGAIMLSPVRHATGSVKNGWS